MRKTLFCLFAFLFVFPCLAFSLPVTVSFDVLNTEVHVGDQFSVNLVADIPDPVSGFGLDVNFDHAVIDLSLPPVIGSSWNPLFSFDGDGLAGLAPFPLSVFGTGILLANFTFDAISVGTTDLLASFSLGDLTEGFPLAFPAPPGSFAEVSFLNTTVTVMEPAPVPEPSTFVLLFVGVGALLGFRSYRKV